MLDANVNNLELMSKEELVEMVLCQDLVQVKMRNFSPF